MAVDNVFLLDGDDSADDLDGMDGMDNFEGNEFEFDEISGEPAARDEYASEENADLSKDEDLPGFEEPEPAKPEPTPASIFEQMSRMQNEQMERLARQHQEQMNLLIEKLRGKKEPAEEDIPDPDLDTWEDPNRAVELKVRKELAEYDRKLKEQKEAAERQQQFQSGLNQVFQGSVKEFPDLGKTGTAIRKEYENIANNYNEQLLPFLISCTANYLVSKKTGQKKEQQAVDRGAVQERGRQARVKQAAMHSSRKTEKAAPVKSSDPEEIKAMRVLGIVSPEEQKAYLENRKRLARMGV